MDYKQHSAAITATTTDTELMQVLEQVYNDESIENEQLVGLIGLMVSKHHNWYQMPGQPPSTPETEPKPSPSED